MNQIDLLFKNRLRLAIKKPKQASAEDVATEGVITEEQMASLLAVLGPGVPRSELTLGIEVEKEHGPTGPHDGAFDISNGEPMIHAKIAAAHLAELPDYYTRLHNMEEAGEAELGISDD